MALGPGKYDELCTNARNESQALGAILMIIAGKDGDGFSCQAPLHVTLLLPKILRDTADMIEADLKRGRL